MVFIGMALLITAVDLSVKSTIEDADSSLFPKVLSGSGGRIVLHRNHNDGFPFGLCRSMPKLVRGIPLVITSAVAGIFVWLHLKKGYTAEKLSLAMILGGALSNLYDRMVRRYVVDYFSIQWKGLKNVVFNIGDIFIFAGTGLLFMLEVFRTLREK